MPDISLSVTYASLRREIGRFLGYGRDPDVWAVDSDQVIDVEDVLLSGVRRVLTPPPIPGEKMSHEWTFLRPVATLTTTTPYTTGTIAVADGVATLTGGTWPAWAAQGRLTITPGTYAVATRTDNTHLVLVDTTLDVDAGETYSLGRAVYDLPSDFAMLDGPMVYAAGDALLRRPVERISETQLLEELRVWSTSGCPRWFAIRPKAVDLTAATAYELLICPTADGVYSLYYHYRIGPPGLDSTNTTPPGGDAHGELYLEACLAAAEQKLHDNIGLHSQRFLECLVASVNHDRRVACPDTLGFNVDRSDGQIDWDSHEITNNGLTLYNGQRWNE